jgi:hypothetical protein
MEAAGSYKMVTTYQATKFHNQEDCSLNLQYPVNLSSHTDKICLLRDKYNNETAFQSVSAKQKQKLQSS